MSLSRNGVRHVDGSDGISIRVAGHSRALSQSFDVYSRSYDIVLLARDLVKMLPGYVIESSTFCSL